MGKMLVLPFVGLFLAAFGCATSYQSQGFTGGFTDTQLAPDVFRVAFRGNAYTSMDRAQDFALLRAAELSLQNGFNYFAIINESDYVASQTINTPGYSQTNGNVYVNGNVATYSGTTTYLPEQSTTFFRPRTGLLFRGFAFKPDGIFAFDAAFLQKSLRDKYKIDAAPSSGS